MVVFQKTRALCQMIPQKFSQALHSDVDVVLVSGGTSVGQEDHAPRLVAEHGELGHPRYRHEAQQPDRNRTYWRAVYFPASRQPGFMLCAYDFFAGRAIRELAGYRPQWPYATLRLPLRKKLVSAIGRVDYARVRVVDGQVEPLAIGGASILSSTTRSEGFVIVPQDSEGFADGTEVDVFLYDSLVAGN